jgi:hypothetical protein
MKTLAPKLATIASTLGAGLALLLLAGCDTTDPQLRTDGVWVPTGVNDANLAAEIANPSDLVVGQSGGAGTDGHLAAAAVRRLRQDKVKALPDSGLSDIQVTGGGSAAAPAGGGTD